MRILLVEDNEDIAASIAEFLEAQGCECDFAYNGLSGLYQAVNHEYDLYIFDIAIPGMDGLQLCRTLRQEKNDYRPVLFLTARDTLNDKLEGFASGADDYLVKPFELQELYARLGAIAKRYYGGNNNSLHIGDLHINLDTHEVFRDGREIELAPITFKLLQTLMQHSPKLVSREQLTHEVWGDDLPDSDSLRSHIYKLRQLIDRPFKKPLIHTVQGHGFRVVDK
ncbi:DNA-binding response regulator [Hahella sp. CCB-MM4]|uniref:response regulator transcription factor n=1 Tax=Hahella sp. (strain CCB-MM4) TaxID=1926491 RepID=UPI000B9C4352|nr:response regulator transcription factor [Hahella sp. CCB-MM4]OZG72785.1 DNA-binding response regulator [Hahella sp. CCB-MM4]